MPPDELAGTAARTTSATLLPRPLRPGDIDRLYLDGHPRIGGEEAAGLLMRSPGSSFWIPETSEFIIVTPWRHRPDLVTVHTFGAFANEDALLAAAMDHARGMGLAGFVIVDLSETRHPSFYERHGLLRYEEIVTYEHRRPDRVALDAGNRGLDFQQVTEADRDLRDAVLALDHAAFPWFWWNSGAEFDTYLDYPGVEIWAGIRDHDVVSYAGITQYRRWSHLDRIATRPGDQGTGVGRATLAFAMERMVQRGGRRIALSTQGNNMRSRRLYDRAGFVRTPFDDYSIFVAPFDEARIFAGPGANQQSPVEKE
jgi:ribosomal protein S18 acetylase RimI-like enzyme